MLHLFKFEGITGSFAAFDWGQHFFKGGMSKDGIYFGLFLFSSKLSWRIQKHLHLWHLLRMQLLLLLLLRRPKRRRKRKKRKKKVMMTWDSDCLINQLHENHLRLKQLKQSLLLLFDGNLKLIASIVLFEINPAIVGLLNTSNTIYMILQRFIQGAPPIPSHPIPLFLRFCCHFCRGENQSQMPAII